MRRYGATLWDAFYCLQSEREDKHVRKKFVLRKEVFRIPRKEETFTGANQGGSQGNCQEISKSSLLGPRD
jgi:hypothetical protein